LSQVTVTAESSELVVYAGLNDVLIVSDRARHSARKSCGYWRRDREPGSGYRYREVYALISKSMKLYSIFVDQWLRNLYSMPIPSRPPVRVALFPAFNDALKHQR
jgi:hypothetical protein